MLWYTARDLNSNTEPHREINSGLFMSVSFHQRRLELDSYTLLQSHGVGMNADCHLSFPLVCGPWVECYSKRPGAVALYSMHSTSVVDLFIAWKGNSILPTILNCL